MLSRLVNIFSNAKPDCFRNRIFSNLEEDATGLLRLLSPLFELADSQGIQHITPEMLVWFILVKSPDNNIKEILNAYDVLPERYTRNLDCSVRDSPVVLSKLDLFSERIVARACFQKRITNGSPMLERVNLVISMLTDLSTQHIFQDMGLSALNVKYYLAHKRTLPDSIEDELNDIPVLNGQCWIVIKNDDYTEMESVRNILIDNFEYSEEAATEMMLKIHYDGSISLGPINYNEAIELARKSLASVREDGGPLSITVSGQEK